MSAAGGGQGVSDTSRRPAPPFVRRTPVGFKGDPSGRTRVSIGWDGPWRSGVAVGADGSTRPAHGCFDRYCAAAVVVSSGRRSTSSDHRSSTINGSSSGSGSRWVALECPPFSDQASPHPPPRTSFPSFFLCPYTCSSPFAPIADHLLSPPAALLCPALPCPALLCPALPCCFVRYSIVRKARATLLSYTGRARISYASSSWVQTTADGSSPTT